jgi:alpha-beta hydrolase superfamily lysophospholipase
MLRHALTDHEREGGNYVSVKVERVRHDGLHIPAVAFIPERPLAFGVVVHGYGGCKEEQFGLAWRLAECSVHAICIDLRGHGENEGRLDERVLEDVEETVDRFKQFGKVIAIGHSLGGRLCLLSHADCKIGVSPALPQSILASNATIHNADARSPCA